LLGDEVDAGHHLGDAVFDLQAGVHLEEVEVTFLVEEELHGAGVAVVADTGDRERRLAEGLALVVVHRIGGGLFDQLLVATLDRAVALAQEELVAVVVDEDLGFDVAGLSMYFST
jgi:hypothetical protein